MARIRTEHPCNLCEFQTNGEECPYECVWKNHFYGKNYCPHEECFLNHDGMCTVRFNGKCQLCTDLRPKHEEEDEDF